MEVGDRVQNIYRDFSGMGTVVAIGDWDDDFNPYRIMVRMDGCPIEMNGGMGNFKPDHLIVVTPSPTKNKGGKDKKKTARM